MRSGIYKITCLITSIIYIGSAVNLKKRFKNHFESGSTELKIQHISETCRGLRKSAGGFKWQYL